LLNEPRVPSGAKARVLARSLWHEWTRALPVCDAVRAL